MIWVSAFLFALGAVLILTAEAIDSWRYRTEGPWVVQIPDTTVAATRVEFVWEWPRPPRVSFDFGGAR